MNDTLKNWGIQSTKPESPRNGDTYYNNCTNDIYVYYNRRWNNMTSTIEDRWKPLVDTLKKL